MIKSKKTASNVTAKMYDTLIRPVITEKSMMSSEAGKVTFMVPLSASKDEVKAAVEAIFNVKVTKVNTVRQFGKEKRFSVLAEVLNIFDKRYQYNTAILEPGLHSNVKLSYKF